MNVVELAGPCQAHQEEKIGRGKTTNQQNIFDEIGQCAQAMCNINAPLIVLTPKAWTSSFLQACQL